VYSQVNGTEKLKQYIINARNNNELHKVIGYIVSTCPKDNEDTNIDQKTIIINVQPMHNVKNKTEAIDKIEDNSDKRS
jgi:hypothetical protein